MMAPIVKVPDDVPAPTTQLCWVHKPDDLIRCDRAKDHLGDHSWMLGEYETAVRHAAQVLNSNNADYQRAICILTYVLERTRP